MLKNIKNIWDDICLIGSILFLLLSGEESRQLDYDMGYGEIDK